MEIHKVFCCFCRQTLQDENEKNLEYHESCKKAIDEYQHFSPVKFKFNEIKDFAKEITTSLPPSSMFNSHLLEMIIRLFSIQKSLQQMLNNKDITLDAKKIFELPVIKTMIQHEQMRFRSKMLREQLIDPFAFNNTINNEE